MCQSEAGGSNPPAPAKSPIIYQYWQYPIPATGLETNVISGTLLDMRLRSAALALFALILSGTPAKADQVVFTTASSGVDFAVSDDGGFYVSSSGIQMPDASSVISGSSFALSAGGAGYSDAGIVLFFNGGLILGELQSVTVATGNPAEIAVNLWIDTNGDGQFFAFNGSGLLTSLDGDSYGSFGNTTDVTPASSIDMMGGGPATGATLADLQANWGSSGVALWIGITNTNTAGVTSVTVDMAPEPAYWPPIGIGLLGLAAMIALRSIPGGRPERAPR